MHDIDLNTEPLAGHFDQTGGWPAGNQLVDVYENFSFTPSPGERGRTRLGYDTNPGPDTAQDLEHSSQSSGWSRPASDELKNTHRFHYYSEPGPAVGLSATPRSIAQARSASTRYGSKIHTLRLHANMPLTSTSRSASWCRRKARQAQSGTDYTHTYTCMHESRAPP